MKRQNQYLFALLVGAIFFFFSNGRYLIAPAAWLFPACWLWVARKPNFKHSYLLPIFSSLICQIQFWKFTFSRPDHFFFYIPMLLGTFYGLMFCLDRWIYPKIKGFVATLFFPLLYTTFDFLLNLFNPFGTTGVLGYSQIEFLSFAQLASITGMWGLTFMITWFGSVINWMLDNWQNQRLIFSKSAIYFTILALVFLYGGIRTNMPLHRGSVKIASMHSFDKDQDGKEFWAKLANKDLKNVEIISNKHLAQLIEQTRQQAKAGAKIIVWSESTHNVLKQKEDSLKTILGNLAKELNIYLLTNPYFATTDGTKPENKIQFFDPSGNIILTHYKYGGAFLERSVEGDGKLKTVQSSFGKLSALICWDADFPSNVKQVGQQEADILLIPASDWREIDPLHTTVAQFRGIENGCSVVRQVRNGLSVMADPRGKVIAKMDHFESDEWLNVGQVPTKRLFTLYPILGDWFGWLAMIGLLFVINKIKFKDNATPYPMLKKEELEFV